MVDWYSTLAIESELPAFAVSALRERGFVVLPGAVSSERMKRLINAYDAAAATPAGDDVKMGSASTRVSGLVNRDAGRRTARSRNQSWSTDGFCDDLSSLVYRLEGSGKMSRMPYLIALLVGTTASPSTQAKPRMSSAKHRYDLSLIADRRAHEGGSSLHTEQARMPRSMATPTGEVATVRSEAAQTRRERRVKKLLLKELARHSAWRSLSYAEKQHLEKRLNAQFIDKELTKLRKGLRWLQRAVPFLSVVAIGLILFSVISLSLGNTFDFDAHLQWQINTLAYAAAALVLARSTRRKMFIYEALRELSGADEIDVTLSRAVVEADALIDRIVKKELQADRRYLEPLGLSAS